MSSIQADPVSSSDLTPAGFREIVQGYVNRRGPIEWMDWLPLTLQAADTPELWGRTFAQLEPQQQYELLSRLRDESSGPLADALLVSLAQFALEIEDEQVRVYALEDAAAAHARNLRRLETLRERFTLLTQQAESATQRLQEGFNLGLEVARLEQALIEIRHRECEQDDAFARIHTLESEILRLETRRRLLDHYDEPARLKYRTELELETEAAATRKRALEQRIADAIGQRDVVRREVVQAETDSQSLERELQSMREQLTDTRAGIERLQAVIPALRQEDAAARAEHRQLLEEIEVLERSAKDMRALLDAERNKLEELREASARTGFHELQQKVDAVYALLPADAADQAIPTPGITPERASDRRTRS